MNNFGRYVRKEKYVAAILRALRDQGWICPEYDQARKIKAALYNVPEYCGTIAQKGDWSFVLWNHSPYAKEFAVPEGKKWALYYKSRQIYSGRNLKPPINVVKKVVEAESMPTWELVAKVLSQ